MVHHIDEVIHAKVVAVLLDLKEALHAVNHEALSRKLKKSKGLQRLGSYF